MIVEPPLTPAALNTQAPKVCSICQATHITEWGVKDFSQSSGDFFQGTPVYAPHNIPVRYHACQHCGFVFTNAFDDWTRDTFAAFIYNANYIHSDTPMATERPTRNAHMLAGLFHREKPDIRMLDFCGGNGVLAQTLRGMGFAVDAVDPFFGAPTSGALGSYQVVTSFEVIEHVPHREQAKWLCELRNHLVADPTAVALISTELHHQQGMDWWYIAPRNGHISIHSAHSLGLLAQQCDLRLTSINNCMHLLQHDKTRS